MTSDKKFLRQCISCREFKDKSQLIKITKDFKTKEIRINQDNSIQGRSVYICKNEECVKRALKKGKIEVLLKGKLPSDIHALLDTILKN